MTKPSDSQIAAKRIHELRPDVRPQIGIVCGSGLGALADSIEDVTVIPYEDLHGFPACSVEGHGGYLYLGYLHGVPVACLQGRVHYYEGHDNAAMQTMIRTLKRIGCEVMLATNSSGSLREEVRPGDLVLINDHINFQFRNPLVGQNDDRVGPRFISMENAYDADLRAQFHAVAKAHDIALSEGVYFGVLGPTFESPAEIRAYRVMGAEVIGMSTVADVIVARHCGLRVAVVSVISNMAAGMHHTSLSHEETLSGAKLGRDNLLKLVYGFIEQYKTAVTAVDE